MELRKNIAISDTGFVFDATTGESYSLNPTGLEILLAMKKGMTEEEIRKSFLEKYDVDESGFDLVFFDFLRTLQQLDLLAEL